MAAKGNVILSRISIVVLLPVIGFIYIIVLGGKGGKVPLPSFYPCNKRPFNNGDLGRIAGNGDCWKCSPFADFPVETHGVRLNTQNMESGFLRRTPCVSTRKLTPIFSNILFAFWRMLKTDLSLHH